MVEDDARASATTSGTSLHRSLDEAMQRLAKVARQLAAEHRSELEKMKKHRREYLAQDFMWEALLRAMSTMGSARGAELTRNRQLNERVLEDTLRKAGVRMPSRKMEWLLANLGRIQADGGPLAVKEELEACVGRGVKIKFLRTFRGIGEKYARNIMMDVYDPDFRDSIASDARITNVAEKLGVLTSPYKQAERFFLRVATEAGLNGWELDRLLYNFTDEVLVALS